MSLKLFDHSGSRCASGKRTRRCCCEKRGALLPLRGEDGEGAATTVSPPCHQDPAWGYWGMVQAGAGSVASAGGKTQAARVGTCWLLGGGGEVSFFHGKAGKNESNEMTEPDWECQQVLLMGWQSFLLPVETRTAPRQGT